MAFEDVFLPALYQPPSPWYPGGKAVQDVFTPALMTPGGPSARGWPSRADKKYPDIMNWLDPRLRATPGYYPHALISYYTWRELTHPPFPDDGFLFGDSGGFSIMTKGAKIDPRDVMRWQLRTCTVGAILDVPPISPRGKRFFDEGLAGSCKNTRVALPLYLEARQAKTAFRWWGVIQGWTLADLKHWWEHMVEVYPFADEGEGWALKPRPNVSARSTARVMGFVQQHPEIRRVHLLATTGVNAVATLMCLGERAGLDFASYDSTTFTLAAVNRTIMEPTVDGLGWTQRRETGKQRQVRDALLQDCQCASCAALRGDVKRYPELFESGTWQAGPWVFRFAYHNLLCMLQVFANVRRESADAEHLLETLLGREEASKVWRAFEGREVFNEVTGTPRSLLDWAT